MFIPADLEAAKIAQARALGATVVRVDGPYDDVNRLCLELTDELEGWAVLNVNLRPSMPKAPRPSPSRSPSSWAGAHLMWSWHRWPRVRCTPSSSAASVSSSSVGLLDEAPVRYFGGQANGCAPIANAFAEGADVVRPVERPDTVVRSLSIGSPADGAYSIQQARATNGAIIGVPDEATIDSIRLLAETEGIFTETAGGVTLAALRRAIDAGQIKRNEEVVLVITGNGLKTLDVLEGTFEAMPEPIAPTFDAFEAWWETQPANTAD